MTSQFSTRVQAAQEVVDEDTYTIGADGARVRQSSAPRIIATMLDLLHVEARMRVLEIGTGTGYSTANARRVHRSTVKLPVCHRDQDLHLADAYAAAIIKVAERHKDLVK